MDEKQTVHHRQHFNLSESAKQMLEQLTTQRYPGRQRRQSQVIEDLIIEAFKKERNMATVANEMQEPEPNDWLAPETREALHLAQQEAQRMQATEVFPEHLLSGIIAQGNDKATRLCPSCKKETRANWKHCAYCGASLAKHCPHCGSPYPQVEGARFCFECGKPLQ